jgi:hypothetical protein
MKVDHKTFIGGFVSLIIKIALTLYVSLKFKTMFMFEADDVSSNTVTLDLKTLEPIQMNETETMIFWYIEKTSKKTNNLFYFFTSLYSCLVFN